MGRRCAWMGLRVALVTSLVSCVGLGASAADAAAAGAADPLLPSSATAQPSTQPTILHQRLSDAFTVSRRILCDPTPPPPSSSSSSSLSSPPTGPAPASPPLQSTAPPPPAQPAAASPLPPPVPSLPASSYPPVPPTPASPQPPVQSYTSPPAPPPASAPSSSAPITLTTKDAMIVDSNGREVRLHGLGWFGFNDQRLMVGDLNQGYDSVSKDLDTVLYRIKALGFNALRLAFDFQHLSQTAGGQTDYLQNCTVASPQAVQQSVTPPDAVSAQSVGAPLTTSTPPPQVPNGVCNEDVPEGSVWDRFIWTVQHLVHQGFYVVMDFHTTAGGDQSILNMDLWIQLWQKLLEGVYADPAVTGKLLMDLINEPDALNMLWNAGGQYQNGLTDYYLNLMDVAHAAHPDLLFMIEGTGQTHSSLSANWGDGFATDPAVLFKDGPSANSDPRPFFNALLNRTYIDQVIIAPHVYGPAISYATTNYAGGDLWTRLNATNGYLAGPRGYCSGGACHRFPLIIGEFGTNFTYNGKTDQREVAYWSSLVQYMNADEAVTPHSSHAPITSWFFWCWNADSSDTGGILEMDWRSINWQKMDALAGRGQWSEGLGLKPWYA